MTKKKRELIEILLDNITPDDWPVEAKFAAQDKKALTWGKNKLMFYKQDEPPFVKTGTTYFSGEMNNDNIIQLPELCKQWNKTIVHRDEFMKRWNERHPVVDSEGWIKWNGGEMPVEKGTLIDVKYRNKSENIGVIAGIKGCKTGSNKGMYAFDWRYTGRSGDIIAYRLHAPQQQKTPQQLALEKFGTDWHDNEGVQPVDDEVLVDVMFFNETKSYQSKPANIWLWSVESKTNIDIKKWRIHSDVKESQADFSVRSLACDDGPMVSEPVRKSPLSTQVGGDHYAKLAIQPMQYSMENGLDPLQHTVIKYVTRFRDKAGIEDLEKAKHCIDMLIEFERSLM